jgi:hypothetical protein
MAKYRRTESEVEAFQFTGQGPTEWPDWAKNSLDVRYERTCVWLDGEHGSIRVNQGDWIAKDVTGRLASFTEEEFAKLFAEIKE